MKNELLGYRCSKLSMRHREWGECYMTDIDHIVTDFSAIEYSDRKAVSILEYKHGLGKIDRKSANIAATQDVADRACLPFFIVQYDPKDWEFLVRPRNEQARTILPTRTWMNEREYVCFLYRMRGREAPADLLARLGAASESTSTDDSEQTPIAAVETTE